MKTDGRAMGREGFWRRETPGPAKTLVGQSESARGENISKLRATLGCLSQVEAATRGLGVLKATECRAAQKSATASPACTSADLRELASIRRCRGQRLGMYSQRTGWDTK
jgi:hypothetical protein